MDIKNIKSEFPIFNQKINGKPLVYLDSANSSQKPKKIMILSMPLGHLLVYGLIPAVVLGVLCLAFTAGVFVFSFSLLFFALFLGRPQSCFSNPLSLLFQSSVLPFPILCLAYPAGEGFWYWFCFRLESFFPALCLWASCALHLLQGWIFGCGCGCVPAFCMHACVRVCVCGVCMCRCTWWRWSSANVQHCC